MGKFNSAKRCVERYRRRDGALDQTQQHCEKCENASQYEHDRDSVERRLPLFAGPTGNRCIAIAPQVLHCLTVFPGRDDRGQDAAEDQRQSKVPGGVRKADGGIDRSLAKIVQQLDDSRNRNQSVRRRCADRPSSFALRRAVCAARRNGSLPRHARRSAWNLDRRVDHSWSYLCAARGLAAKPERMLTCVMSSDLGS